MTQYVSPERTLILTQPSNGSRLKLRASQGVESKNFETHASISFELLRSVMENGDPILLDDASQDPVFSESSSVILAGLKSVLCAPFTGENGEVYGVVYADCPSRAKAFTYTHLVQVQQVVSQLERCLRGIRNPAPSQPEPISTPGKNRANFGVRPGPTRSVDPSVRKREKTRTGSTSRGATARFFRGLSVMISAGVPLLRALDLFSDRSEDPILASTADAMASDLRSGITLSRAMSRHGAVFSPFALTMVGLGEKTGALANVLRELARYEERSWELSQKLRSALVYPLILLTACLFMAVIGPPYLFGSILQLLNDYQVELPLLTRVLMVVSKVVSSGYFWVAAALLGLAGVEGLKRLQQSPQGYKRLMSFVGSLPHLGEVLRHLALARTARALALQLKTGLGLLSATGTAMELSTSPALEGHKERVLQALREGESLDGALASTGFFPGYFLSMVEVGLSTGKLDSTLNWLARFEEEEFERRLEALAVLLEPLLLFAMGGLVGVMLIGTMTPFLQLLQNL